MMTITRSRISPCTTSPLSGMVGLSCFTDDCGICSTLITSKIMSLGSSTTALLSTSSCQGEHDVSVTSVSGALVKLVCPSREEAWSDFVMTLSYKSIYLACQGYHGPAQGAVVPG
jgi:hypothetical protein